MERKPTKHNRRGNRHGAIRDFKRWQPGRMSIPKLALALLLMVAARAGGGWTTVSSEEPSSSTSCRHVRSIVQESESGERAQLHLAIFDSTKARLRIIDQPSEPRADLAAVMQKERCLAGVNGGYFDPDYAPVGLLISDGHLIAPLRKARLLSGILSVTDGRVRLLHTSGFTMKVKINSALQSGPFLVDQGRAIRGLESARLARRTFVATTGSAKQVALGFCTEVSLAQLSQILLAAKNGGALKIERALNLDGGSSSAFWFADDDKAFSIPEQKTVRDFLAVVAK